MFKKFRLSCIILVVAVFTFVFSFSALQACTVIPEKGCCSERDKSNCSKEACAYKEAKLVRVSTGESAHAEEVVLNIKGMTCGGCANKVKGALSACEGVKDVQVSYQDGKAVVHVEDGKSDIHVLIEAVKHLGYKVTEG